MRFMKQGAGKQPFVRVVNLHGTASADSAAFKTQLSWVREHYSIIDFQEFVEMFELKRGTLNNKPAVLFTFDDGLESNYRVAAPILESMGARGVFFVIPQFAMSRGQDAKAFFDANVRGPAACPPGEPEEVWKPMSPEQIVDLARRGHTIGNHTFSHAWLSTVPAEQLHRQIVESALVLQSWIGSPPQAFAWTFSWRQSAERPAACEIASPLLFQSMCRSRRPLYGRAGPHLAVQRQNSFSRVRILLRLRRTC